MNFVTQEKVIMLKPGSLSARPTSRLEALAGVAFLARFADPAFADLLDPATLHTGTWAGTRTVLNFKF